MKPITTAAAIGAFCATRAGGNASKATITWYEQMLKPLDTNHRTLPLDRAPIEALMHSLTGAAETKIDHWRALRIFYRWCSERWELPNPMLDAHGRALIQRPPRRRKLPKALTDLQVDQLRWANAHHPRDLALIDLILDTGARIGELAPLKWRDVHQRHAGQPAYLSVSGKTGDRDLYMQDHVFDELVALEPARGGRVWSSVREPGQPISVNGLQQAIGYAGARANLQLGPHALRHTFGKLWVVHGGDIVRLQQILGHSSISTTRVYLEMAQGDVKAAHAQYSPMANRFRVIDGGLSEERIS